MTRDDWGVALLNSIRGQPTEADALHVLRVALQTAEANARRAALRERDALHAVELEHTRAYAIREAAQVVDSYAPHLNILADRIRALLEGAGK